MNTDFLAAIIGMIPATALATYSLIRTRKNAKEIEIIKAKNQRDNFVHQLQFQKEFTLYTELWGQTLRISDKYAEILNLTNHTDFTNLNNEFKTLIIIQKEFLEFIRNNSPFFEKEIFHEIENFNPTLGHLISLSGEETYVQNGDNFIMSKSYSRKSEQISASINSFTNNIRELIRARITVQ
jgi:hypothetical protein